MYTTEVAKVQRTTLQPCNLVTLKTYSLMTDRTGFARASLTP